MTADVAKVQEAVRRDLDEDDLPRLFLTTLGWDRPSYSGEMREGPARAVQIAEKRGVGVWLVEGADPERLAELDKAISLVSHERLIATRDADGLVWRWPERRRSGSVRRSRLSQRNPGELTDIVQRLATLRFDPQATDNLTVLDVRDRVRRSFNTERVTETFYKQFKACHELMSEEKTSSARARGGMIEGIAAAEDRRWYASVLLNRLMFLYFLEKKGFLANDHNYLRNRLRQVQASHPRDPYAFYAIFLVPLFHEALGAPNNRPTDDEAAHLVGDVPYLNGGVFAVHPLEVEHTIKVHNEVFDRVFDVFDSYRWHLDDREDAQGDEINPDILGHIFERYVNQRDTGAFYTPNDTTGWMAGRSIGTVLLGRLEKMGVDVAALAAVDPARYVAKDLLYGAQAESIETPFPGAREPEATAWSQPASADVALPDETRWEVRDRVRYGMSLVAEIGRGELGDSTDALIRNVDALGLVADGLVQLTPAQLDEFWVELFETKVIDPTCGSGAFLLAVLDVLEEVADAVITRAQELSHIAPTGIWTEMSALQPSAQRLYVRQRFVLECLFGTDIAEEAIEIARLRLYLSLVAVMTDRRDLRPLPDLEFNLIAGNLLVGVNSKRDMEAALGGAIWSHQELAELTTRLAALGEAIHGFREAQADLEAVRIEDAKQLARSKADDLRASLDAALHKAVATGMGFDEWLDRSRPLHFLAAFPDVMLTGGFDVVIGNPPYVKRQIAQAAYRFDGYRTSNAPDIYAPCTERALGLTRSSGVLSFVLPYSAAWSDDFVELRNVLSQAGTVAIACFGRNPDALFRGVGIRNAITFVVRESQQRRYITAMQRWTPAFRPALFGTLRWHEQELDPMRGAGWLRLGNDFATQTWRRLTSVAPIRDVPTKGSARLHSKKTALYWLPVSIEHLRTLGADGAQGADEQMVLAFGNDDDRFAAFAAFASRLALVLWNAASDDFHVIRRNFEQLPLLPTDKSLIKRLAAIGRRAAMELADSDEAHLWTPYAGYWVESLDTRVASDTLDEAVVVLLEAVGLEDRWDEFESWYWRTMKSTGERPGTERGKDPPTRRIKGGPRRHELRSQ